jgi:hypothetical protein
MVARVLDSARGAVTERSLGTFTTQSGACDGVLIESSSMQDLQTRGAPISEDNQTSNGRALAALRRVWPARGGAETQRSGGVTFVVIMAVEGEGLTRVRERAFREPRTGANASYRPRAWCSDSVSLEGSAAETASAMPQLDRRGRSFRTGQLADNR